VPAIPIVFITGNDPVRTGLVASLARPGGNATGVNVFTAELAEKRFGLLNDAIPAAASFAVLANPNATPGMADLREVEAAGRRVGKDVAIFHAGSEVEIDSAFARIAQWRPGGTAPRRRSVFQPPARADCDTGRAPCHPGDLRMA